MTSKERFFTLIIIFTLLSTNIHGLHKNAEQSTNDSIVNVTRKSHDSSGSVKNTPKPMCVENDLIEKCVTVELIIFFSQCPVEPLADNLLQRCDHLHAGYIHRLQRCTGVEESSGMDSAQLLGIVHLPHDTSDTDFHTHGRLCYVQ